MNEKTTTRTRQTYIICNYILCYAITISFKGKNTFLHQSLFFYIYKNSLNNIEYLELGALW
jgi:hypothetical protein